MSFARRALLLASLCASVAAPAQAQSFSLEQLLSAPFPTDLVAAPVGGAVAWVFNDGGTRNVWVATAPGYAARSLTSYKEEDGQEIGGLTWAPDGGSLVYTRGEGRNGAGEYPNPRGAPLGGTQQVWQVAVGGGAPRLIGEGHDAVVSPKDGRVAFIRGGEIWSTAPGDSGRPSVLVHERGENGSLSWSPDGGRLAFVSDRGDYTFIGVLDLAAERLTWLDPSTDRDFAPVWSPDSKAIGFIRTRAAPGEAPYTLHRRAEPWSIRVADAATGAGHEIWRADSGQGSAFRELGSGDQLFWLGDHFAFPWERDGWLHLYAVPVAGGAPTLLTPGAFEVEHVIPAADHHALIFSSNRGDIDRRHLWRVAAAGGSPTPVTSGTGIEWSPAATADGGAIAFLRSDARRPPRPAIRFGADSARDLAPAAIPAGFPEAALVEPRQVLFHAADGLELHGQLFLPADLKPGEHRSAIVFFHGGSEREMLLGWHYMLYYRNAYAMNQYLAGRGYIVLSVNYRSGIGYGMKFREAPGYGPQGASEYADVLAAGLYLRHRADVDSTRVGAWGGSYGGFLTALALARASNIFAAGVDFHGVHDWNVEFGDWTTGYKPEARAAFAKLAWSSSPMSALSTWRSPVLLVQGDDDRNVAFGQTVQLAAALRARHVDVEELIFPDEIHDFLTQGHWLAAYHAGVDFFERHLPPKH